MVKLGDLPIAALTSTGTLYAQADHLNTVRALQNAAGVTVWRWNSDPFGAVQPEQDPDGNGIATVFPLRFPGQYYDAETGTHYNYHRDYDPAMGRYTQADPLGVAGGLNVYAYVGNDPLRMVDPLGLVECGWWNQNCSFGDPAGSAPRCATAECAAGLAPAIDPWPKNREPICWAECNLKKTAICSAASLAGAGLGATFGAVASIPSGGTLAPAFVFIGSRTGMYSAQFACSKNVDLACSEKCTCSPNQ